MSTSWKNKTKVFWDNIILLKTDFIKLVSKKVSFRNRYRYRKFLNHAQPYRGRIPFKNKHNPLHLQRLRCWELMTTPMFIITSNNKTPQSLRSHSCLHLLQRRNNGGQLTQGGSKVRRQCQSTIVGGPGSVWHHTSKNQRMAWFEKGNIIYRD